MTNSKIESFIQDYQDKLHTLNKQLQDCVYANETIQLEINFIHDKELPEAIEKRVIDNDASMEKQLRKSLSRLQKQLREKQEELIVLQNIIEKFKVEKAEESSQLSKAFNNERSVATKTAYKHMMHAKRAYVDAILEEAKTLRKYSNLDSSLQQIEVNGHRKYAVYPSFPITTSPSPTEVASYGGIYLQLPVNEVRELISSNYNSADEISYLRPFKHKKG